MEKHFRLHGVADNAQTTAHEIRKAIQMIDWLMSYEEMTGEIHEELRKNFAVKTIWEEVLISGKKFHRMRTVSENGSDIEEFKNKLMSNHQKAEKMYEDKKNELFHYLKDNIEKWWD